MAEPAAESYSTMKFTLNNSMEMPAVGLGTYRLRQEGDIMKAIDSALRAGYRMFDTAAVYRNERHLNKAFKTLLPEHNLKREDIYITTKLSPSDHGTKAQVEEAYMKSIENLGVDYVDLYLIHFPGSAKLRSEDWRNKKLREVTWASMVELYDEGKVNAIGVSNYTKRHLEELLINSHGIVPAVNQVEWHPQYHQKDLLSYCKQHDIVLQAYSSLGGASSSNYVLMEHPVVQNIAKKMNATCAQVLLVWALQQDVAVIPKSMDPERIKENISLNFRLSNEDMKALDALGEDDVKHAWNPNKVT